MKAENVTISISKAALIVVFFLQVAGTYLASWYGNKAALKELEYKIFKVELEYKQADELMKKDFKLDLNEAIMKIALKPDEIRLQSDH